MHHKQPIRRRVLGCLEDGRRVGLIDADLDRRRLRRVDRVEEVKRWRRSPGGVDDQVCREMTWASARVLETHPSNRTVIGRGSQLRHTRARPELNIGLAFDPATADALQRGARQAELIETEVALRKRIEARNLEACISANAHPNGAGLDEIELDAWKQMLERSAAARKKPMCVPCLRRTKTRCRHIGQSIAVEHGDLFEMGSDGFCGSKAPHPCTNDDSLLQNRI